MNFVEEFCSLSSSLKERRFWLTPLAEECPTTLICEKRNLGMIFVASWWRIIILAWAIVAFVQMWV